MLVEGHPVIFHAKPRSSLASQSKVLASYKHTFSFVYLSSCSLNMLKSINNRIWRHIKQSIIEVQLSDKKAYAVPKSSGWKKKEKATSLAHSAGIAIINPSLITTRTQNTIVNCWLCLHLSLCLIWKCESLASHLRGQLPLKPTFPYPFCILRIYYGK